MPEIRTGSIQVHPFTKVNGSVSFLVLKRSKTYKIYPGMWQVITGTIDKGETALATALRELREETGHSPLKFWHIPFIGQFYDYRKDIIHKIPVFAAELDNDIIDLSDEHDEYKWLSYDELNNHLELPSHREGTRYLMEYILNNERNKHFRIM